MTSIEATFCDANGGNNDGGICNVVCSAIHFISFLSFDNNDNFKSGDGCRTKLIVTLFISFWSFDDSNLSVANTVVDG